MAGHALNYFSLFVLFYYNTLTIVYDIFFRKAVCDKNDVKETMYFNCCTVGDFY